MSENTSPEKDRDGPPLSMEQALELLLDKAQPIAETGLVGSIAALGRVLADPVISTIEVPGWNDGAMDGYAVRIADLGPSDGLMRVSQRIPAGTVGQLLEPGTAARIFTGAPVPEGADAVGSQALCAREGDRVRIPLELKPGANIRRAGEDIAVGSEVIGVGTRLRAQHLGLTASVGAAVLNVFRRLRVAIFSSGDELVMPGIPLGPGQIYNSNRFTLHGLLVELGCDVLDLGIVPDTLEATMDALRGAAERADLILASGGVSVGEEDHVKPAVERLGSLDLWKIAIRPGKPLAFGRIADSRT
ncbi:MAG: molybdopterin molybdotransferase MoeA, partial [Candidatus Thiosymbion ectosymbiont of Robbea hypermnestra]|nr:molybdopterin molybdotransferase MoeA [Candidatus Thiosymbion ectosymbiont of Robbea hypermnestra]